jgi:hypothetical protein
MLVFNTNVECVVFYKMNNSCSLYKLKIIDNYKIVEFIHLELYY